MLHLLSWLFWPSKWNWYWYRGSILIKIAQCHYLVRIFLQNCTTDFDETLHVVWVCPGEGFGTIGTSGYSPVQLLEPKNCSETKCPNVRICLFIWKCPYVRICPFVRMSGQKQAAEGGCWMRVGYNYPFRNITSFFSLWGCCTVLKWKFSYL